MRADRLLSMMMLLQTHGKMKAQTLAQKLGVSRRTILRDIEALSLAGIPIYAEGGHGGGISLDENYRTTLTGLKENELRTLFISSNNSLLNMIGLGEAAHSTHLKLSAALPSRHQSMLEQVRQRLYIDPIWWWHDTQPVAYWTQLQQAVFEDRRIHAVYGDNERILEPYGLVAKASQWYLIAQREGELRIYRISRFQSITLLDATFQRPPDFDLTTYWHQHIREFVETLVEYTCTLRIHDDALYFIKWLLPGRHQIIESDGAWHTIHFQLESRNLAQMLVFGLGTQVEVIDPPELDEDVFKSARAIVEKKRFNG
jgi:predicted DNA-binding transcriptional regulator YafY